MGKPYKPLAEGVRGKAPSSVINAPETVKDGKRLAVVLNRLMTWDFGNKTKGRKALRPSSKALRTTVTTT